MHHDQPTLRPQPLCRLLTVSTGCICLLLLLLFVNQRSFAPILPVAAASDHLPLNHLQGTLVQARSLITGLQATNSSPTPLGQATRFTATVSGDTTLITYTWHFGDGISGSGVTATHTYTATGIYSAGVVAANTLGVLTATTQVTIIANAQLYFPLVMVKAGPKEVGRANITIAPLQPRPSDALQITLDGIWRNGCAPSYKSHQVSNFVVTIDTTSPELENPSVVCGQALTPWRFVVAVDPLPAGAYLVNATGAITAQTSFMVNPEVLLR